MDFNAEIAQGDRFEFGQNWSQFLPIIDQERIQQAEMSLKDMLEVDSLTGKSFLDIGSGSGLFSLAARRLGARVHSFDFDPKSVFCTRELKKNYFPDDDSWKIEEGSVLDDEHMKSLGHFDVVYSWVCCITQEIFGPQWRTPSNTSPLKASFSSRSITTPGVKARVGCG